MRHYHRDRYRRLNDSERYRDIDYIGDDGWIGANETVPHGSTTANEPPWWSFGPYDRRPFAAERALDEDRGQGRQYGQDLGPGYGRAYDPASGPERRRGDPYDRRIASDGAPDWVRSGGARARRSRSDEVIYREVRDRLAEHAGAHADDVAVEVEDGEVMLCGVVEDRRIRYLAEDVADDVAGVTLVRNRLRIRPVEDTRLGGSRQSTRTRGGSSVGAARR